MEIKYNKLVRDNIPQIIKEAGKTPDIEIVSDEEYLELLNKKLDEELKEYNESGSIEELADIVEVIYAIIETKNISIDNFLPNQKEQSFELKDHQEDALKNLNTMRKEEGMPYEI